MAFNSPGGTQPIDRLRNRPRCWLGVQERDQGQASGPTGWPARRAIDMNRCPTAIPVLSPSQGSGRYTGRENGQRGGFCRGLPVSGRIRPSAGGLSTLQQELAKSRAEFLGHSILVSPILCRAKSLSGPSHRPTSSGNSLGISRVEALRKVVWRFCEWPYAAVVMEGEPDAPSGPQLVQRWTAIPGRRAVWEMHRTFCGASSFLVIGSFPYPWCHGRRPTATD